MGGAQPSPKGEGARGTRAGEGGWCKLASQRLLPIPIRPPFAGPAILMHSSVAWDRDAFSQLLAATVWAYSELSIFR